jgi:hypothetical protein
MPLDVGVGILFAIIVSHFLGMPLGLPFVVFGIASALLPDIDMLPFLWRTPYDHRSVLHAPIVYLPVSFVIYFLLDPLFAQLFVLCVYAHLIHDTVGLGWGIRWLWPFSTRHFLLFPEKGRSKKWFMSWTDEDEKQWAPKPDTGEWVKKFYLRPNLIAYIEYGVCVAAVCILIFYLHYH